MSCRVKMLRGEQTEKKQVFKINWNQKQFHVIRTSSKIDKLLFNFNDPGS